MAKLLVKASTLLETVVALTILSIVTAIALVVFVQATKSGITGQKLRATVLVNQIVETSKTAGDFSNKSFEREGIYLQKSVSDFGGAEGVLLLRVIATDVEDNIILEYKELVLDENL